MQAIVLVDITRQLLEPPGELAENEHPSWIDGLLIDCLHRNSDILPNEGHKPPSIFARIDSISASRRSPNCSTSEYQVSVLADFQLPEMRRSAGYWRLDVPNFGWKCTLIKLDWENQCCIQGNHRPWYIYCPWWVGQNGIVPAT